MKFEDYLREDCPFNDETSDFLNIRGRGVMKITSREVGIAGCTSQVEEWLQKFGLDGECIPSGTNFEKDAEICKFVGPLKDLFRVWRTVQTLLSITCSIAKATGEFLEKARAENRNVVIATTRKTHPGLRNCEMQAIRDGGGTVHRNSLSDSILITQNHLNIVQDIPRRTSLRPIEIEPRNEEEALKYANVADIILLDHFTPEQVRRLRDKIKKLNSKARIAVSGGITLENVATYARHADIIITSEPYYAKPLDMTTEISRIN